MAAGGCVVMIHLMSFKIPVLLETAGASVEYLWLDFLSYANPLYITLKLLSLLSWRSLCCSAHRGTAECTLCVWCCPFTHIVSNRDLTVHTVS